jgi:hypothetical protein
MIALTVYGQKNVQLLVRGDCRRGEQPSGPERDRGAGVLLDRVGEDLLPARIMATFDYKPLVMP